MAKQKQLKVVLPPGNEAFNVFLAANPGILNKSGIERMANLPDGTLRHFRAGTRLANKEQFESIKKTVLPKLLQLCLILQEYQFEESEY